MNTVVLAVGIAAALVIAIAVLLPSTTRTTVEIRFDAPIREVWEVYTDFESQPSWRSDVRTIEMASDKMAWTETLNKSGMTVRFRILEKTPPSKLILKTGADGNFEGRYVAEFRQRQDGTIGVFTEQSTALGIAPKVLRTLFFNQRKFIEEFAQQAKAEIERRQTGNGY